jgi:hypothetical protein
MKGSILVVIAVALVSQQATAFRSALVNRVFVKRTTSTSSRSLQMMSDSDPAQSIKDEPTYESLAISGFISKKDGFAETDVFSKLYATGKWSGITTITDDIKFARKRFVNPSTVYSGMIDVLDFTEVDSDSALEGALAGKEAWLAYGVTSSQVSAYADIAAKHKMKRAVFAVKLDEAERGADVTFASACAAMKSAGVEYTIVKYGDLRPMAEAKYPYRIVRDVLPLPTEGDGLSTGDLWRVRDTGCPI